MTWREQMIDRLIRSFQPLGDEPDSTEARKWAEIEFDRRREAFRGRTPPRFADATPELLSGKAAEAFDEWVTAQGQRNVLLFGPVGTGKTFAATAFLAHVSMCGVWRWNSSSTVRLLDRLRPSSDGEDDLDRYAKVDVLLLDDLGGEKPSDWVAERLFLLFDERWRWQRPTLVTTNLLPDQLRGVLGDRTYSRLQDDAIAVTLTGSDRRRAA